VNLTTLGGVFLALVVILAVKVSLWWTLLLLLALL